MAQRRKVHVTKVKQCRSTSRQTCFVQKRGSRKRSGSKRKTSFRKRSVRKIRSVRKRSVSKRSVRKRSVSKRSVRKRSVSKKRSVSRRRRSAKKVRVSRKKRTSRRSATRTKRTVHVHKEKNTITYITNFFKLDDKLVEVIKHPKKNKKSIGKLIGYLLAFILAICALLKAIGSDYNCSLIIEKVKDLGIAAKEGGITLTNKLNEVRALFFKFVHETVIDKLPGKEILEPLKNAPKAAWAALLAMLLKLKPKEAEKIVEQADYVIDGTTPPPVIPNENPDFSSIASQASQVAEIAKQRASPIVSPIATVSKPSNRVDMFTNKKQYEDLIDWYARQIEAGNLGGGNISSYQNEISRIIKIMNEKFP